MAWNSAFFTLHPMKPPSFFNQRGPTQLDHKSPIPWGNSWSIWFSGRWPLGGPFFGTDCLMWAQKRCFWPEINFLCTAPSKLLKRQFFHIAHVAEQAPGGCSAQKWFPLYCIAWHRMVLHGIALYLIVLHSFQYSMVLNGIVLYIPVLHGTALLASACGLYLPRHLSTLRYLCKLISLKNHIARIKIPYKLSLAYIDYILHLVFFSVEKVAPVRKYAG